MNFLCSGFMANPSRAVQLQTLCKEYLQKADYAIQAVSGNFSALHLFFSCLGRDRNIILSFRSF